MSTRYEGPLPTLQDRHFKVVHITPDLLITPKLQSGSGGLGVVSGSHACELENSFAEHQQTTLFVGFYCSYGYHKQRLNDDGYMKPDYERDPNPDLTEDIGVRTQLTLDGKPCMVAVRVPRDKERTHTAVILLDTDLPENSSDFRMITRVLYGERHATRHLSEEHKEWHDIHWLRIFQSAVLGLGTYYVLKELNISYDYLHMNESHAVFFPLHHFGLEVKKGKTCTEALETVSATTRFTNHTILESGNKWYPRWIITQALGHYEGFKGEALWWLDHANPHNVSMTNLALKLAGKGHTNAVSKHHAVCASRLWPDWDIFPITNGVSPELYQHPEFATLQNWKHIPELKRHLKAELYNKLKERAYEVAYNIRTTQVAIDKAVLIAWARRGQDYKRPGLLFHDREFFGLVRGLLQNGQIAIAWGGYVHPDDDNMTGDWNKRFQLIREHPNTLPVFNYRMDLMLDLKAGAQIWVNTPIPGFEACGTSWMSAMLNCALVVSTLDGGIREAKNVVLFGERSDNRNIDENLRYNVDANDLWYKLNDYQVLLRRNDPGALALLFDAKQEAEEKFLAKRMVTEYREKLFV